MKRRGFLRASVVSGALAFPGAALIAARAGFTTPPDGLQKLFGDEMQIRRLGVAYLATCPEENKIETLQRVCAEVQDVSLTSAAIQYDFECGNVVAVDGWVLSRTEARHCALFSMLASGTD